MSMWRLTEAIRDNKVEEVERVLNDGNIDINKVIQSGRAPLHLAVEEGHENIVILLLERGADITIKHKWGRTPLHCAVNGGHENIVILLLERGADINIKDKWGRTPLHWAMLWGHENIVILLLERGADLNIKNKDGRTLLYCAVEQGHENIVRLLLERGADINIKNKGGITPLHCAALKGHENIVKLLLERGADINIKNKDGSTPLHCAALKGHENVVILLLERGADINIKDEDGRTPLHWAVMSWKIARTSLKTRENIVRLLLERGAAPNIKDEEDETPCNLAEKQGFQNIQDLCQRLIAAPVQAYLLREMIIYLTRELLPLKDVRMLARERLGIPDAKLDNLEYNYSRDAEEQAYQIMWLWKERTAGATVYDLFKALKDHQLNDSLDQIHCKFRDRVRDILNRSDDEFKKWLQPRPTMAPTNGVDLSKMRAMNLRCLVSDDMKHLYVPLENFNDNADKSNINTTRGVIKYRYFGKGIIDEDV